MKMSSNSALCRGSSSVAVASKRAAQFFIFFSLLALVSCKGSSGRSIGESSDGSSDSDSSSSSSIGSSGSSGSSFGAMSVHSSISRQSKSSSADGGGGGGGSHFLSLARFLLDDPTVDCPQFLDETSPDSPRCSPSQQIKLVQGLNKLSTCSGWSYVDVTGDLFEAAGYVRKRRKRSIHTSLFLYFFLSFFRVLFLLFLF
jgi:hypothetical protein